jgi:hypothetical protein
MEIEKKSIKKMFPNLVKELEGEENKVKIDSVRANAAKAEEAVSDPDSTILDEAEAALPDMFRHYNPTVVDFIRRCDTQQQAEEIICFLLKRKEITSEQASEIRTQIKKEGLRSLGPKKEEDYYFKQSGLC